MKTNKKYTHLSSHYLHQNQRQTNQASLADPHPQSSVASASGPGPGPDAIAIAIARCGRASRSAGSARRARARSRSRSLGVGARAGAGWIRRGVRGSLKTVSVSRVAVVDGRFGRFGRGRCWYPLFPGLLIPLPYLLNPVPLIPQTATGPSSSSPYLSPSPFLCLPLDPPAPTPTPYPYLSPPPYPYPTPA